MPKITIDLSVAGLDELDEYLNGYKQRLQRRAEMLRDRLANQIRLSAQAGFDGSIVDDLLRGSKRYADVKVEVEDQGDVTVVIAHGEDAIWVEFGAGVFHNGPVGSSPHVRGKRFGYTIGGYGLGHGQRKVWGFIDDNGELQLTHGTEATRPLWEAFEEAWHDIYTTAKEVFSD